MDQNVGNDIRHIVCAVRGQPESRETITLAIDLALQHKARLTFFHVIDAEFLAYATVGPPRLIYQELVAMAEFTMLILKDRAERRGVQAVDYLIREGNVRKQICNFAVETHADLLIVGRPKPGPKRRIFKEGEIEEVVAELEKEANVKIVLV